jgi:hypothetical protein
VITSIAFSDLQNHKLDRTSRLPVVYVFGRKSIDVQDCVEELTKIVASITDSTETTKKSALIRHDVAYTYRAGGFADFLPRTNKA